jgi:hypothetical protein
MKPKFLNLLLASLWCVTSFSASAAQTVVNAGTVRGVVSDKSGAVVPAAAVVLLSRGTAQRQTRSTNAAGIFLFPSQPVGPYTLEVSAAGFGKTIVEGVYVQVGQPTTVDVELQPGSRSESITVSGESPLLRGEDSNQSSVVNRELLEGLPLNGRRFLDLGLLVPNAAPDGQNGLVSFAGEQGGEDTGYANANGSNSFSVDGASASSNYFGNARGGEKVPYIFGENAIEEFQVAVSPYRAEYGGAATGFINVVTRSGSDALHGGGFYYNRNSGIGVNDAVSKANGFARPVERSLMFTVPTARRYLTSKPQFSRTRSAILRSSPLPIFRWWIPISAFRTSCKRACRLSVRSCVTPSSPSALLGRTESTWLRPAHMI